MAKEPYDHHRKAGNQGDVIKHIALIAALDKVLDQHPGQVFRYADIYAGYAHNPLVKGFEWKQGVGKLAGRLELNDNDHAALYAKWYLSRPALLSGVYPGSSVIAADVCSWKSKRFKLFLWDTEPEPWENLSKVFHGQEHSIYHGKANVGHPEVMKADFLFIDPPDLKTNWELVKEFLSSCRQPVLVWLPVNTTEKPPGEDRLTGHARGEALEMNYSVSKVRWEGAQTNTKGCQLVYRLPELGVLAVRNAVQHVAKLVNWTVEHYDGRNLSRAIKKAAGGASMVS